MSGITTCTFINGREIIQTLKLGCRLIFQKSQHVLNLILIDMKCQHVRGFIGLSDGLITAAGKGHRVGSVVVDRALESPQRTDEPYRDCLSHQELGCRTCIKRCPADAISEAGHDKARCMEFVMKQIPVVKEEYGIDIYGCGLCQTGVPCAEGVPKADPK